MLARIALKATCLLLLIFSGFSSKAQLHADFAATPLSSCAPAIIQFYDSSTGNPTSWTWDLGNGTTSFQQNPSATYFNPGVYSVKLVIKDAWGSDSITKTKYITVNALPTVAFTSNTTTGCYPLDVQFADQSLAGSGTVAKWEWDFGDGFTSSDKNPVHTYTGSGNFNVTLRITNSNGCTKTLAKTQYITITNGVLANYTTGSLSSCKPPLTINFQNTSTGTGTLNYAWSFGDGTYSTLPNPSHIYTTSGSYTVQLITSNNIGCADTLVQSNAISVGSVNAAVAFADSACQNSIVTFKNTSSPAASSVLWSFGDNTTSTVSTPSKTYTIPGTYTVKLMANFGACKDSASKSIVISPQPVVLFSTNDTASCKFPFTVNFNNQSANGVSYKWSFGDNTTSTLQLPSHTYNAAGNFTVTLVVTNANGCMDTLVKTAYIKIQPPAISTINAPDSSCAPFTKTFVAKVSSSDSITNYLWDFGDGNTSNQVSPSHTYTALGSFTVSLTITTIGGCTATKTIKNGIVTTTAPDVAFSVSPRNTCAKGLVNYYDSSIGTSTKWLWAFGDGSTSTIHFPSHIYNDTGIFNIQLIAWNRGCPDTLKIDSMVHISPPIAKFKVDFTCTLPFDRTFTDQSIGADQWNWDFGDGSTSTQQSPKHTYADTGTYTIALTVYNNLTGCDFTTSKTLKVVDPKAIFFASDTIICKGTAIKLTDPQGWPGNVTSYTWNFGDATGTPVSTVNNISHTYTSSGLYTNTLIITDVLGCKDTLKKVNYIRVNGPTAKFAVPATASCSFTTVNFLDSSSSDGTHPIQTWVWNYGDGTKDTLTSGPFSHTYKVAGNYTVWLKTFDSQGCVDSVKLPTTLIISKPTVAFISSDTLSCPNKPVSIVNRSSGVNLTYVWNFGDNATSTSINPTHTYINDGIYDIKLVATDKYGCKDSLTKPSYVSIKIPVANFSMSDSIGTCPPLLVRFTNLSANADTIKWDFGDGSTSTIDTPTHFYTYPGIYTVKLDIKGFGGCTSHVEKKITILGPTGTFAYTPLTGCIPVKIDFNATTQNTSSIIWDFNDGVTLTTTKDSTTHIYDHSGSYLPRIILSDSKGCHVPIIGKDSLKIYAATAKFGFNAKTFCDSGMISFTDSSFSNDNITAYTWNFGDGSSSNLKNPTHQYATPGMHYPSLTVATQTGCINSMTAPLGVKVIPSPKAGILTSGNGCAPLNANFNGQLLLPDTSAIAWNWDFGNGSTSTLQNPSQQSYTNAGVYKIKLRILNSTGCSDTTSKIIEAYAVPVVDAGKDFTICEKQGQSLNPTGADTYSWSPVNGLSCSNCTSPVATPASETKYYVTGATTHGCTAKDSIDIKVKYPFTMTYGNSDSLCRGGSRTFHANGAATYAWSPSRGLSSTTSANPVAQPDSTTTYQVIGTDDLGCFKDTGYIKLKIFQIPTVDAGPDKTINVGQSLDLVPTISDDVIDVKWYPTGSVSRNFYPGITVKPNQTTEYTVEVKNQGGCTMSDRVSVFVVCNGANVFIPNTFSPNDDGVNDIFYPRGTGLFSIKSFRVFNRWGEVMYEKHDFMPNNAAYGWDGTFKGVKLSSDVYVYTVDIVCDNNSVLTFNGNIALVR
ncbi:PKD domain-containing protein [Ferruginibacter albus]|uniref:PKD domain-containing protein n=1 Tax=Ferruginibacter albus TaxID=2875540 RepID=UPI001CC58D60|nr:PKD domain-containing protein [Ferruginibacter albus]UAY51014.1 PKD domain-containing protein [Ferruginibacter albus]